MPSQTIQDTVWKERLDAADRYHREWEDLFKCRILEDYYEGRQWKNLSDTSYRPYTINKVYETIQIKVDQFIPQVPKYNVSASPTTDSFDLEDSAVSSALKEDVLNTIIWDNRLHFHDEMELAYKDSFFRFGVIEVGYSSDWIINPNASRPLLNSDTDKQASGGKPKVKQPPAELPYNERVYFKHIAAKRFRVGGIDHKYLDHCTWCGYYEWVNKNDLLALKGIMNRDKIQIASVSVPDSDTLSKDLDSHSNGENVKIWHIWHNKAQKRIILLDSPCITIFERSFKRLPLFDLRHDRRVSDEGFYPIPPVWHWLSAQDEINETREQLRKHRKRFTRKFLLVGEELDDEELEKWENGDDGALVKASRPDAIKAIENAPLDNSIDKALVTSADDLNQISGTSSEVRGVADRTTATQANIINSKATIRESAGRDKVAVWFDKIGREALLICREKFVLGIWAKLTTSNSEQLFQEMQENKQAYKWVTSEDLKDSYDFHVIVDITSLSADAQEIEKQKFLEFLAIVSQYPQVAMSPTLIRECAYRCGYRNEKVIREMQKMALLHQFQLMQGVQQANGGSGGQSPVPAGNPMAQQVVANKTPNKMEQIRQQIQQSHLGTSH